MIGVVLWANHNDKQAVVWCEDHGNLAYIGRDQMNACEDLDFDAGDLIQFDLEAIEDRRIALNPSIVAVNAYPSLPEEIRAQNKTTPVPAKKRSGQVIAFPL